jgi:hypothetical protein
MPGSCLASNADIFVRRVRSYAPGAPRAFTVGMRYEF